MKVEMYNCSGIMYRVLTTGITLILIGAFTLVCSKFWNKEKIDKKNTIIAICILIFAFGYEASLLHSINNIDSQVKTYEGYFVSDYRTSFEAPPLPFTHEYTFSNGTPPKQIFYLDTFSKKKIFSQDFSKKKKYRIYYAIEKVIVRVEVIDE